MRVKFSLESAVESTPRLIQMSGIFDLPPSEKSRVSFDFDAPLEDKPWQIGLVVGPSGAGKSSVARHMFGEDMIEGYDWPSTKSIVDGFGKMPIKEITGALSSVGFSSPPNWVRPFGVLSNGERFRANMARAIVDERELVVIDEFTSVVDRQAACVGSHAMQKAIRARTGKRFVAVTCHYDVESWLQPDWILEPHIGRFHWRSVQPRPSVKLEIVRVTHEAWGLFAAHHYLSASLNKSAKCFVGLVDEVPACFGGLLPFPHPRVKNTSSISRLVVLPDYQGLGLGAYAFTEALGKMCVANGRQMIIGSSHPALIRVWAKSAKWLMTSPPDFAKSGQGKTSTLGNMRHAKTRRVAHFKYAGPGFESQEQAAHARRMWL